MMELYRNIKERRERLGLTQTQLADRTGYADKTMISKIEKGMVDLPQSKIQMFAEALGTTASALMGWDSEDDRPRYANLRDVEPRSYPMLGFIACGEPIFMDEEHETYIMSEKPIKADFCLTAKGDSMIDARINDGDIVFIKRTQETTNGKIYAVAIDDEATLKRVYYDKQTQIITLVACNPRYAPIVIQPDDGRRVKILGRAVYFQGKVK